MNYSLFILFYLGILITSLQFIAFRPVPDTIDMKTGSWARIKKIAPDPKDEAFEILDSKCNVCHKKQNPFRVFRLKNMSKNAPRIYQQVFVLKRMPKGDEISLTEEELQTLEIWLKSENIN